MNRAPVRDSLSCDHGRMVAEACLPGYSQMIMVVAVVQACIDGEVFLPLISLHSPRWRHLLLFVADEVHSSSWVCPGRCVGHACTYIYSQGRERGGSGRKDPRGVVGTNHGRWRFEPTQKHGWRNVLGCGGRDASDAPDPQVGTRGPDAR
jgi:hypothetical protein